MIAAKERLSQSCRAPGESGSLIDSDVASAIDSALARGTFPHLSTRRINTGFLPVARAETEAAGKLDHQVSPRHSLINSKTRQARPTKH